MVIMKKVAYAKPPPMVNVKRGSGNVIGLKSTLVTTIVLNWHSQTDNRIANRRLWKTFLILQFLVEWFIL